MGQLGIDNWHLNSSVQLCSAGSMLQVEGNCPLKIAQ
jgi:hypothetical protein